MSARFEIQFDERYLIDQFRILDDEGKAVVAVRLDSAELENLYEVVDGYRKKTETAALEEKVRSAQLRLEAVAAQAEEYYTQAAARDARATELANERDALLVELAAKKESNP